MKHTKELLSVPLASLVPSRFNVRRHSVGQVEELAALIEAQGLLHNLVVTEQEVGRGKSRKLKFAVAAGEPAATRDAAVAAARAFAEGALPVVVSRR